MAQAAPIAVTHESSGVGSAVPLEVGPTATAFSPAGCIDLLRLRLRDRQRRVRSRRTNSPILTSTDEREIASSIGRAFVMRPSPKSAHGPRRRASSATPRPEVLLEDPPERENTGIRRITCANLAIQHACRPSKPPRLASHNAPLGRPREHLGCVQGRARTSRHDRTTTPPARSRRQNGMSEAAGFVKGALLEEELNWPCRWAGRRE